MTQCASALVMHWIYFPIFVLLSVLMHVHGPAHVGVKTGMVAADSAAAHASSLDGLSERASNLDPGVDGEGLLSESVSESEHEPSAGSSAVVAELDGLLAPPAIWDRPFVPVRYDATTGRDSRGPPVCRGPPIA